MSRVNLSRKLGEPIRLAYAGHEALVTVKSFDRGELQICIEASPQIKVARVDTDLPVDLFDKEES